MSKPEVIGGKLKLKGSGSSVGKKRTITESQSSEAAPGPKLEANKEVDSSSASKAVTADGLTEAQRRHRDKRNEQLKARDLKKLSSTTYRERLEQFNMKLASTTEHNDIPRISAAGNG